MFKRPELSHGVWKTYGPFATVYSCSLCKESVIVRRGRNEGAGRGFGLRTGGGAYSRMRAHVRAAHPSEVK